MVEIVVNEGHAEMVARMDREAAKENQRLADAKMIERVVDRTAAQLLASRLLTRKGLSDAVAKALPAHLVRDGRDAADSYASRNLI